MDFDEVVAFDNLRHSIHVIAEVRCDEGDDPRALYAARGRADPRAAPRSSPGRSRDAARRAARAARDDRPARRAARLRGGGARRPRPTSPPATASRSSSRSASTRETDLAPFEIYRALRRVNPSPYMFFVKDGDRALVGSSPETLVKLEAAR